VKIVILGAGQVGRTAAYHLSRDARQGLVEFGLPDSMQRKVWTYFDDAESHYGKPWPITYRTDEATRLETLRTLGLRAIPALSYPHKPGMALGLWENIALDEYSLFLPKGSLLVMFTDGMTDCRNPKGEPFGLERIKYTMAEQRAITAQLSCDQLFDNLMLYQNGSKQDDDVTLVAVHAK